MFKTFKFYPRHLVISIIRFYQKTLSFDHGPLKSVYPHGFCRFNPSCSEYSVQAIEKYGIFKGGIKSCWRIIRCNPFNKGGNDPLI
ncbi:MAG: membrane protein insertion efficiency factor YidD [Candidatus Falkowbacteria bacterium]|nr:membrane protein insertion efficiency factor YidD [Candidatus Falkowbacteria bacterium]